MPNKRAASRMPISVVLDRTFVARLRQAAAKMDMSVSKYCAMLIKNGVEEADKFTEAMKNPALKKLLKQLVTDPEFAQHIPEMMKGMNKDQIAHQTSLGFDALSYHPEDPRK